MRSRDSSEYLHRPNALLGITSAARMAEIDSASNGLVTGPRAISVASI